MKGNKGNITTEPVQNNAMPVSNVVTLSELLYIYHDILSMELFSLHFAHAAIYMLTKYIAKSNGQYNKYLKFWKGSNLRAGTIFSNLCTSIGIVWSCKPIVKQVHLPASRITCEFILSSSLGVKNINQTFLTL